MIIKKETKKEGKDTVTVYHVDKDFDDAKMEKKMNKMLKRDDISLILDESADVHTADGKLLLRFRKNAIKDEEQIEDFYENIIRFAKNVSSNRGSASGSKKKNLADNPKVMSNIFGYFDKWSPSQKVIFKKLSTTPKLSVRPCRFNVDYPEQYKKTVPLVQTIDALYEKLIPEKYKLQRKKANETPFKIPGTSFTTVTTNVNYQTSVHTDKGDDVEGFGNLAVIEKGEYSGGETCFPQYGIGVNVRKGDVLFMDVHQPHANLPIQKKTEDTIRLSIVCYLRKNVWLKSRGTSKATFERHNKTLKKMMRPTTA
jgi:hypothetical protein